jgi:calcium-dependent protein kinase
MNLFQVFQLLAYKELYGPSYPAESVVNDFMASVDIDNNGYIEYSEFISAAINKEKAFTNGNLKMAFNYFDTDKSGKISISELKKAFGNGYSEEMYKDLIKEFDLNKDGEISLDEFTLMMGKLALN